MHNLRNFIFVDGDDDEKIESLGLGGLEAAYENAIRLANERKCLVVILEEIDTVAPDE